MYYKGLRLRNQKGKVFSILKACNAKVSSIIDISIITLGPRLLYLLYTVDCCTKLVLRIQSVLVCCKL